MPTVQDKEHDVDAIDGPRSLSEVTLAKSPSTQHSHIVFMIKCISVHNVPHSLEGLTYHVNQPRLPELTWQFLYDQLHPDVLSTMPQVTCVGQEECTVNVYGQSSHGIMVHHIMIVFILGNLMIQVLKVFMLLMFLYFFHSSMMGSNTHVPSSNGFQQLGMLLAKKLECGGLSQIFLIDIRCLQLCILTLYCEGHI